MLGIISTRRILYILFISAEKAYHDTMKAKSTIQFDFDWGLDGATLTPEMVLDGCGKTKGCFLHPETCTGRECEYIVSYVSRGLYTDFEVSVSIAAELGENVYVGVGVNTHAQMVRRISCSVRPVLSDRLIMWPLKTGGLSWQGEKKHVFVRTARLSGLVEQLYCIQWNLSITTT